MKKTLLTLILGLFATFTFAQNIEIVDPKTSVEGSNSEIVYISLHVKNNASVNQDIYAMRKIISLTPGHLSYFCFGVICYPPNVNKSPVNILLTPGAEDTSIKTYIDPVGESGSSVVKYCIFNKENTDSACLTLNYNITSTGIINNSHLKFVKVFPNPAESELKLVFNTEKRYEKTELQISDLNGRVVFSEAVTTTEGLILTDVSHLPSGIYICNLVADGSSIARDKVIVR